MQSFQENFIQLAIECEVLRFGHFTLKSGRVSPYFFNAGHFQSGKALSRLSQCYAQALQNAGIEYDMLFGPAYKGIPLATSTACALFQQFDRDVPYCFNRKEAKSHGEGGSLVGAPLQGNIVIVDDVITAGTAIRESLDIIEQAAAHVSGILVGLDRQEKGQHEELSAISELERSTGVSIISIIKLEHILSYLESIPKYLQEFESILAYAERYGTK